MNMQKATNTVKMYFPLMPDCYKRYYLEGGPNSICMEVHMIGTETVFIILLDHGKREDRKDMRLPGVGENLNPPMVFIHDLYHPYHLYHYQMFPLYLQLLVQWDHQHLLQENLCRKEGPLFQFTIMKRTI